MPGMVVKRNFAYLVQQQVEAIVKYSTYHQEKSKKWQQDTSKIDNWQCDEQEDTGHVLLVRNWYFAMKAKKRPKVDGFVIKHRHFHSSSCEGCALKSVCTKAQGNREIRVSLPYLRYK